MDLRRIDLETTLPLRQKYLRPYLRISECRLPTDEHPLACHFGAYDNTQLLGVVSVAPAEISNQCQQQAWQLRMMATREDARLQGVGRHLVAAVIAHVQGQGATCLWCNARVRAQGFYQKQGFAVVGNVFNIEPIGPHVKMLLDIKEPLSFV